jgi:hypothetical protein
MPLNLMQANAGTQGLRQPMGPPQTLPPGVPQPGPAMGAAPPAVGPTLGTPAGLASLSPSGYRGGPGYGRGGTDFSAFPGGAAPAQAAMAPGMSDQMIGAGGPPQGMPGMDMRPDLTTPANGSQNAFGPPMPNLTANPAGGFMPPTGGMQGPMPGGPPPGVGPRY